MGCLSIVVLAGLGGSTEGILGEPDEVGSSNGASQVDVSQVGAGSGWGWVLKCWVQPAALRKFLVYPGNWQANFDGLKNRLTIFFIVKNEVNISSKWYWDGIGMADSSWDDIRMADSSWDNIGMADSGCSSSTSELWKISATSLHHLLCFLPLPSANLHCSNGSQEKHS